MRLRVNLDGLEQAARRMGAPAVAWRLDPVPMDPVGTLLLQLREGIEVDLEEVEVNRGDLLTYQGQHVLLYIMEQGRSVMRALEKRGEGYKFHVADCRKLKEMRVHGRYERYVATNRTDGRFRVRGLDPAGQEIEGEAALYVCRLCLTQLNYAAYRHRSAGQRTAIVSEFDLGQFFETYSSYFERLPLGTDEEPSAVYGPDWERLSRELGEVRRWRCARCGVDLSQDRHLLQLHHQNGQPRDHRLENLVALCADCYSKEAGHRRRHVSRRDRQRITHLRNTQSRARPREVRSGRLVKDWKGMMALADPAVHGLLDLLQHSGFALPEVGYEVMEGAMVAAQTELAWPADQVAVVLAKDEGAGWLEGQGWSVYTPSEAILDWFDRSE